ncbi:unnamed protein product, partial [Adineta steineri]
MIEKTDHGTMLNPNLIEVMMVRGKVFIIYFDIILSNYIDV